MKLYAYCIAIICLLNACLTFKVSDPRIIPLNENNFHLLNGVYTSEVDTFFSSTLADFMIMDYENKFGKFHYSDTINCKIEMLDHKSMEMTIYRNSFIDMGLKYKGKIKNGYFEFTQEKLTEPYFIFVLRIINKRKARLGILNNENHDLLIETKSFETSAWFYIRTRHFYDDFNKEFLRHVE